MFFPLIMLCEDVIIFPKHYFILRHAGQLGHVGSFIQVVNSNITKFMLLFSNNRRLEYVIEIPSGLQYKRIRRNPIMCEALRELMKEEIEKEKDIAIREGLAEGIPEFEKELVAKCS